VVTEISDYDHIFGSYLIEMFWHFDMHVKNLGPFSLNAKNDRNSELH
jgi:hypothetical protein